MPYQLVRFDRMEDRKIFRQNLSVDLDSLSVDYNNHLRIHIKSPESHQIHELKPPCSLLVLTLIILKIIKKLFVVDLKTEKFEHFRENCKLIKINPLSHLP